MSLGYRFAYNEVTGLTEVNGEPITDMVAATIRTQMRDRGFKSMESVSDAYTTEAGRNRYNQVCSICSWSSADGRRSTKTTISGSVSQSECTCT
jgi:hypothetical protein